MTNSKLKILICLIITAIVVAADQITKECANATLVYGEPVNLLAGIRLVLVRNSGAAFGILSNQSGWQVWFLIGVSVLAIFALCFWILVNKEEQLIYLLSLTFVLSGAVGNLIDRVRFGFVIDFISLYYKSWAWPTFNLADSAICLGAAVLILCSIWPERRL